MDISAFFTSLFADFFNDFRKPAMAIYFFVCVAGFLITTKRSFKNEDYEISKHFIAWITYLCIGWYLLYNVAPRIISS